MSLACHSLSLWGSKHGLESTAWSAWSARPATCTFCQPRSSSCPGPGRPPLHPRGTLGPHKHGSLNFAQVFAQNALFSEGAPLPAPSKSLPPGSCFAFIFTAGGAHLLRDAASLEFHFHFTCLVSIPAPTTPSIAWGHSSVCGTYLWTMPGPEELFSKQVMNECRGVSSLCPGPAKLSQASGSPDAGRTSIEPTEDACASPSYRTGSEKANPCPRSHRPLEEQPGFQRGLLHLVLIRLL